MTIAWQEVLAGLLVALAASYLARGVWRTISGQKKPGCGACGNCPSEPPDSQQPNAAPPIVTITQLDPAKTTGPRQAAS